ncbi:hypothetical protein HDE_05027 [Halotydeus destructor]|nr:hypothetical protein HDE_05027 [Halotydeus destructor]
MANTTEPSIVDETEQVNTTTAEPSCRSQRFNGSRIAKYKEELFNKSQTVLSTFLSSLRRLELHAPVIEYSSLSAAEKDNWIKSSAIILELFPNQPMTQGNVHELHKANQLTECADQHVLYETGLTYQPIVFKFKEQNPQIWTNMATLKINRLNALINEMIKLADKL